MNGSEVNPPLRAVVIGAGFAGEGHTRALRSAGVEVVALCARQADITRTVADRLNVPASSTDWQATVHDLRPDIIALATPASLRRDVVEWAAQNGCHLFCDKPLATTASEAADLCRIVEAAGVKHAFGATRRYDPSVVHLAELVERETIGNLREIVYTIPACLAPVLPWSWALVLAQGGGLLNNHFMHVLSILERIVSGPVTRVTGFADFAINRAPLVPGLHDFRDWANKADRWTPEELEAAEWRPCDADTSYTAVLEFASPSGPVPVPLISGPLANGEPLFVGLRLLGENGVLIARGETAFDISYQRNGETTETPLPVPERLSAELPNIGSGVENRWAALARDFVNDLRGKPYAPYLTFRDGWRYQEAAEAIRSGRDWYDIPSKLG